MPEFLLPVHPLTGLQAVGFRRNGAPIWPILGASEEDDDEEAQRLLAEFKKKDEEAQTKDTKSDDDEELTEEQKKALGDPGKQAIDRMKERLRKEREARKAAEAKLTSATKPKTDDEKPDLDALRQQAREEARTETLRERALDKIEARAARLFKDPEDAVLRLGRNIDDYIDGGKIDVDAIDDALNELLEKRPDFKVTQGDEKPEKRFKGTVDGGVHDKPAGKPQLTKADVERLAKEGKYGEIEDARLDGRLNTLLGIT